MKGEMKEDGKEKGRNEGMKRMKGEMKEDGKEEGRNEEKVPGGI